ncbi:2-hydroxyacid dehydrogenase [Asticcacaulis sp. ZE23SCel15]|uniref:2-hydroxyacid dehydrogenase n=1 Tax=Asticcacaulis sp. ZE23SCel15 TaxID=3059027 RepID=UPI00265DF7A2|nr:2-hydroxyacid dehydrogenase [Asticcacaulis sp. ZE23SCel15]WKL56627.1 2-hydroxyacid dehydrogenase [Asticcacaulis sp. ZE23SCel15]
MTIPPEAVILLSSPPTAFVREEITSLQTQIINPWTSDNPETIIASAASRVRAIINCSSRVNIDTDYMNRFPNLALISNHGVGYDNIDAVEAARRGIIVTNTPDVLTEDVADLAMALLLATVRLIPQADQFVRQERWLKAPFPLSGSLQGRTMGIVGLGRIGHALAFRAKAFGLHITYHGRHRQAKVDYSYHPDLLTMAKDCDTLMVTAPATDATRHMINESILKALGPAGVIINVSRGSLIDQDALISALSSGTIFAAGLDVYEDEPNVPKALIDLDNTVLLPHIGSATLPTRKAMARLVVDNVEAWLSGHSPLTPVPECLGL